MSRSRVQFPSLAVHTSLEIERFYIFYAIILLMKKKLVLLIVCLTISLPLFSIPFSIGTAIGHRNSSYIYTPVFLSLDAEIENFDLYFQTDLGKEYDIVLSYDIKQGKTLNHEINASTQLTPGLGGFQTLSYIFSQNFKWDFFRLKYAIGVQGGIAWSPDSTKLAYSISPMGELLLGFDGSFFSFDLFLTTYLKEERSWKTVPQIGAVAEFDITDNFSLYASAYFEIAELFMHNYLVISAYGGKVGFIYRGGV